jgi:actin-related protein 5
MKKIASLANDERVPKKRKKGNGGGFSAFRIVTSAQLALDDMFGADDADWAIYRKIVRRPRSTIPYCCKS